MRRSSWPTPRQLEVMRVIKRAEYPPSHRELCAALGNTSTNGAAEMLRRLVRLGLVTMVSFQARSVRLTAAGHRLLKRWRVVR